MPVSTEHGIRLALSGKGALESTTLAFLAECGMKVNRSNPRQYLARIGSLPELEVVFQRAADIRPHDAGHVDVGEDEIRPPALKGIFEIQEVRSGLHLVAAGAGQR